MTRDATPVLDIFKADLGVSGTARDGYFTQLIEACRKDLEEKSIIIDYAKTEDLLLLSDYAAWSYRKRAEGTPFPENLRHRIRNRIIKNRARQEEGLT